MGFCRVCRQNAEDRWSCNCDFCGECWANLSAGEPHDDDCDCDRGEDCPETTAGIGGVTLTCDRPEEHKGDHKDAETGATWGAR